MSSVSCRTACRRSTCDREAGGYSRYRTRVVNRTWMTWFAGGNVDVDFEGLTGTLVEEIERDSNAWLRGEDEKIKSERF